MNYLLLHSIIVIVMSFLSFLFFTYILKNVKEYQKKASKYFSLFFLFVALGFTTFLARAWIPESVSIVLNHIFYIISIFCSRQGVLLRNGYHPVPLNKNIWLYVDLTLMLLIDVGLLYLIYDNFVARTIIFSANLSLVTLSLLFFKPKTHITASSANNLLTFAIVTISLFNIGFPISVYFLHMTNLYLILVMPSHIIQVFLWNMIFMLIILVDSLVGYYKSSITDEATGLYTKKYFADFVKKELMTNSDNQTYNRGLKRHTDNMALIIVNLDFFNRVNDTYGHTAGDDVIREISELLGKIMTENIIVSRFGGDEFTICIKNMSDINNNELLMTAEHIRKIIDELTIHHKEYQIHLTASLGVAKCMKGYSFDQLFKLADQALYMAKKNGRNQVYFN